MEKKLYKGIEVTFLEERDYDYLHRLPDEEIAKEKEFLEAQNKAESLTKEAQYICCFMEGYFAARDNDDLEDGVKIWQNIYKHEGKNFDYDGGIEYAKKGWEYYFSKGMNLPETSK